MGPSKNHTTVHILIAPACFKGSLSAPDAAELIASVLREKLSGKDLALTICPIADGGDDTLAILKAVDPAFMEKTCKVMGPVPGLQVSARYLVHPEKKLAVVEAAQAHGMALLKQLKPLDGTSYGVGEIIRAAQAEPGIDTLVVTVGGSASTDGGLGALQALGIRLTDQRGHQMHAPLCGRLLAQVGAVQWPEQPAWNGTLLIATDVVNPLLGPDGTASVFAPQKGASPEDCALLEQGLQHVAKVMQTATGVDARDLPGVGAAGGLAYGLRHFPRSGIVSGSQWVADFLQLEAKIAESQLVITGEGKLDATSFGGKAVGNLLVWALQKPLVIFCGDVEPGLNLPDNVLICPLTSETVPRETAMQKARAILRASVEAAVPWIEKQLKP